MPANREFMRLPSWFARSRTLHSMYVVDTHQRTPGRWVGPRSVTAYVVGQLLAHRATFEVKNTRTAMSNHLSINIASLGIQSWPILYRHSGTVHGNSSPRCNEYIGRCHVHLEVPVVCRLPIDSLTINPLLHQASQSSAVLRYAMLAVRLRCGVLCGAVLCAMLIAAGN
ncbi:hypothetical protein F5Y01DRAFT_251331 [Xylaria sp. FL0043]|nr:hypothetical protein F5Y01DRAFT_251331 [Xylaria sp. FL0043]